MQSVVTNYKIRNLGGKFPKYDLEKRPLGDHTFIYGVSVGKDHFEDDWVIGYVAFLKTIKVKKTRVLVADTLQRHNIACYFENPYEKSVENGCEWVEKYRPMFDQLGIDCQFVHWDEVRLHSEFPKYLEYVQDLVENDPKFQSALADSISDYMQRYANREELPCSLELIESRSRDYLLEECAGFYLMGQDLDLKGIFYPSKAVPVLAYIFDLVTREKRDGNKFHWLEIVAKKQRKPIEKNDKKSIPTVGRIEKAIRDERMSR